MITVPRYLLQDRPGEGEGVQLLAWGPRGPGLPHYVTAGRVERPVGTAPCRQVETQAYRSARPARRGGRRTWRSRGAAQNPGRERSPPRRTLRAAPGQAVPAPLDPVSYTHLR